MGLTEQGFIRRTYDDILNDKIEKAIELFGSDIDTSELTPLGKYIRMNAYDQSIAEEEAEALYYAIFPHTATGVSLDRHCPFVGISRLQATPARYKIEVTGDAGTELEYGFLVGTESEITYYNTNAVTLDDTGKATIIVECETAGEIGNVVLSDITEVINPVAGLSISCIEQVTVGTDVESDVSLRKRYDAAQAGAGSCNENSIRAALLRVPTVTSAGVISNSENHTDYSGRPAHSFECYVAGGENYHQEIAQTIFEKKPIGIPTYGNESVEITDESGTTHTIRFSHTENISVYVKAVINKAVTFEGEKGIAQIQSNIMNYINNLALGEPVIFSALYGQIHAVTGVTDVTSLQLSTNGTTWVSANIDITQWQKAICNNVEVV